MKTGTFTLKSGLAQTLKEVTLGNLQEGSEVNLEADVLGKYVQSHGEPFAISATILYYIVKSTRADCACMP